MQPSEFISNIIEAYRRARLTHSKDKRIRRGRSHSISSIAEDLFAEYLVKNDESILAVYVDQPLSVLLSKKIKTFYPDIVIIRNEMIVAFVDMKLDIGWGRDKLTDLCKKHRATVRVIRGKKCYLRDGVTKEIMNYNLSKSLSYNVVLISRTNINADTLRAHEKKIKKLTPETELFILCDTGHPNNYESVSILEATKKLGVNEEVFRKLLKKLS